MTAFKNLVNQIWLSKTGNADLQFQISQCRFGILDLLESFGLVKILSKQ